MKDAYFFSHDSNARNDNKILAMRSVYGFEGYAWFFMIIEVLREQPGYKIPNNKYLFGTLAMQLQCDSEKLTKFIKDCAGEFKDESGALFYLDDYFYSKSLLKRMEHWDNKKSSYQKAAYIRWEREHSNKTLPVNNEAITSNAYATHLQRIPSSSNILIQNKRKEIKENEIKENDNNMSEKTFSDDSPEMLLSLKLKNLMLINNSKAKVPHNGQIQTWADHVNKMIRIDNHTPEEIQAIIEFSQTNNFWKANILSMGKLREKYDTLYLQSQNQTRETVKPVINKNVWRVR